VTVPAFDEAPSCALLAAASSFAQSQDHPMPDASTGQAARDSAEATPVRWACANAVVASP
jgi:hypothetical protein